MLEGWQFQYLNYGVLALIALILFRRLFAAQPATDAEEESGAANLEPLVFKTYTPTTLAKYNGTDDPRVLIAVLGKVYDVTAGKSFYGPGGPYANFAGHDASRGLAKNSFDISMIMPIDGPIDTLDDLSESERMALADWNSLFSGKYPVAGELVNDDKHK
jgi:membrane-associated progesterone receptor component